MIGRTVYLLATYVLMVSAQVVPGNTGSTDEEAGATDFRLSVDTGGRIVVCEITRSSGNFDDDERACRLLVRRARFSLPIEDGHILPFVYTGRIRFQIAKERSIQFRSYESGHHRVDQIIVMPLPPQTQKPLFLTTHLLIGADSKVERCTPSKSSGNAAVDAAACTALMRNPVRPAVDANRQPVRSIWDMKVMVANDAPSTK